MWWKCCQKLRIEEITKSQDERCEVGEAPHWDVKSQSLFYVDIPRSEILRFDKRKNRIFKAKIRDNKLPVTFIVPIEGRKNEFVVSVGLKVCVVQWDGKSGEAVILEVLTEVDQDHAGNRCNDGKVNPSGILHFGTMGDETRLDLRVKRIGSFYRFSESEGIKFLKGDIGISNGMAWDAKRRRFFYIDSMTRDIKEFKYEPVTSEICKTFIFRQNCENSHKLFFFMLTPADESVLINFNRTHRFIDFIADGMTICSKGYLYVAAFGASRIIVIDPMKRRIINEIEMPTQQITSLAFGGRNLKTLFVTTADKDQTLHGSAGGLFRINGLNTRGLQMNNFIRNR